MIEFQTEDVEFPDIDKRMVGQWLKMVADSYNRVVGNIVYRFCSDDAILKANIEFLGHDYFTDIITFDYSRGRRISGDILISLETVRSNAGDMGIAFSRELLRVISHGVLHLCGEKDKLPGEREKMEDAENRALALFDTMMRNN